MRRISLFSIEEDTLWYLYPKISIETIQQSNSEGEQRQHVVELQTGLWSRPTAHWHNSTIAHWHAGTLALVLALLQNDTLTLNCIIYQERKFSDPRKRQVHPFTEVEQDLWILKTPSLAIVIAGLIEQNTWEQCITSRSRPIIKHNTTISNLTFKRYARLH